MCFVSQSTLSRTGLLTGWSSVCGHGQWPIRFSPHYCRKWIWRMQPIRSQRRGRQPMKSRRKEKRPNDHKDRIEQLLITKHPDIVQIGQANKIKIIFCIPSVETVSLQTQKRTQTSPHSMVFISYSWEMNANTKPYKIKLQKQNCLRSHYFRSTIHHEMIKNLIETISIYISSFFKSSDPEKTISLIFSVFL